METVPHIQSVLSQTGTPPYMAQPSSFPLPRAQTPSFATSSAFCHFKYLFSTENLVTNCLSGLTYF